MRNNTNLAALNPKYNFNGLEDGEIRSLAPAVFATTAHEGVSERYQFVSTPNLIDAARRHGFKVVSAAQPCNRGVHAATAQHRIDLAPADFTLGAKREGTPMITMFNSHDRSRGLTIAAGYFRLVCSNGLMLPSGMGASIRTPHLGEKVTLIDPMFEEAISILPKIAAATEALMSRKTSAVERSTFAAFALELRYRGWIKVPLEAKQLLASHRGADEGDSLWQVLNRVQENTVRGGLKTATGRTSQGISSFYDDVRINRGLWEGAEAILGGGTARLNKLRRALKPQEVANN